MRSAAAAYAGGCLAILFAVMFLDRPIADWAHGLHRPVWCVWLTWIADWPAPAAVAGLLAAGLARLFGWRPTAAGRVLLLVCLTTLAAIEAKDVLKFAFGRTWPETWVNNNPSWIGSHTYGFHLFHGGAGWASFPSGHTTAITATCAALWGQAGRWRPVLVLLPCLVVTGLIGADYPFSGRLPCRCRAWLGHSRAGSARYR